MLPTLFTRAFPHIPISPEFESMITFSWKVLTAVSLLHACDPQCPKADWTFCLQRKSSQWSGLDLRDMTLKWVWDIASLLWYPLLLHTLFLWAQHCYILLSWQLILHLITQKNGLLSLRSFRIKNVTWLRQPWNTRYSFLCRGLFFPLLERKSYVFPWIFVITG